MLTHNKSYLNADNIWKLVLKLWMLKQEFAMEAINPNWTFFSVVVLDSVILSVIHLLTYNVFKVTKCWVIKMLLFTPLLRFLAVSRRSEGFEFLSFESKSKSSTKLFLRNSQDQFLKMFISKFLSCRAASSGRWEIREIDKRSSEKRVV